jgi:hypothetical protein
LEDDDVIVDKESCIKPSKGQSIGEGPASGGKTSSILADTKEIPPEQPTTEKIISQEQPTTEEIPPQEQQTTTEEIHVEEQKPATETAPPVQETTTTETVGFYIIIWR